MRASTSVSQAANCFAGLKNGFVHRRAALASRAVPELTGAQFAKKARPIFQGVDPYVGNLKVCVGVDFVALGKRFCAIMRMGSLRWICSSCRQSRFACSMDC
jgi:hypothetical protein